MTHCGTVQLETKRLILRRFEGKDATAMFDNWASDSEVTRYLRWSPHDSVEASREIIDSWVKAYSQDDYYNWAIVLKDSGMPIGSIGVVKQEERTAMAHIGYCIGRRWWRQGLTSEALRAVMDYLFDCVGVNRIESQHDPRNPNSGKVMKKCGMKYEGTLRSADWNNLGLCDVCCYALLKSER